MKREQGPGLAADELIRFTQYDLRDTLGKLGAFGPADAV
jgi:hypothetical protein